MKVVKPQRVGLLHRVFENGREYYLVVSTFLFFPMTSPRRLSAETSLWKTAASELGAYAVLDEGMPKPHGEVLATGKAFTGGEARTVCSVRVRVGSVEKSLYVIGDRVWQANGHTAPQPFTEMPLSWERAFGGPGYADNPVGRGFKPVDAQGELVHSLPNVENPDKVVNRKDDRPEPAGFGAYDPSWPKRRSKIGTYDATWVRERMPGLAADLDLAFFNTAPRDQWLEDGYFAGDEEFVAESMHPSMNVIEGKLPGFRTRVFVTHRTNGEDVFKEIETRIDTVHLFPTVDRCLTVHRSMMRIAEDDADDIQHLVVACEDIASPKPFEHYKEVLARRLDRAHAHEYALRDFDLLPELEAEAPNDDPEFSEMATREGLRAQNAKRGADALTLAPPAEARAPAQKPTEPLEPPSPRPGVIADKAPGGPPRFSADDSFEAAQARVTMARNAGVALPALEALVRDPSYLENLRATERQLIDSYRRSGHNQNPAEKLSRAESTAHRSRLLEAKARGASAAGVDMTGADLSELDLSGLDLREALLEGALFRDGNLDRADLRGAMLARADFEGASLAFAKLNTANLGEANLTRTKLDDADLSGVVLDRAKLVRTSLVRAILSNIVLSNVAADAVDFSEVVARNVNVTKSSFAGSKLSGSDWGKCNFVECDLHGCDFNGAKLERTNLVQTNLDGSTFVDAHLHRLRLAHESSAKGCDFRGANLSLATLRSIPMDGGDFSGANAEGADFSESSLRGAKFYRVRAREARFVRSDCTQADFTGANLMLAILEKANICQASFVGANLFRADLALIVGDSATSFADANLTQLRFVDRGKP